MRACSRGLPSATFMRSLPSFSAWTMTPPESGSEPSRRFGFGPQGCPFLACSRLCPRHHFTRLEAAGRLTRPQHWQEFIPFEMAHTPLKMTMAQARAEVKYGWVRSYSPEALAKAVNSLRHKPLGYRVNIFIARVCFRGIYFPQMGLLAWVKLISQNRHTIFNLVSAAFAARRSRPISTVSN